MISDRFDLSTLNLVKDLSPDQAAVQERAASSLRADAQAFVEDYRRRFGDEFNPDNGAELFPEYSASPDHRARYRIAVAGCGGWVIDQAFLARIAEPDRGPAVFSAGGTASGKSTMIVDEPKAGAIVLDSTFSNYSLSKRRVQEVLDFGRKVIIQYVYREPREAYAAAIARSKAEGAGRTISPETHRSTHAGAAKTVAQLRLDFADNPRICLQFFESSCAAGFQLGGPELTRREHYAKEMTGLEDAIIAWAPDRDAPPLHTKVSVDEFERMSFDEQAEYLARIALASGNRYRGRAALLLREHPHRDFLSVRSTRSL